MKVNTSKSKNAESFYIKQSFIDGNGKSTSKTIRKLGTLNELLVEHGPTRDDVMAWAKEQARIETEKYELEKENLSIPVVFHPNRKIPHGERRCFDGGYLFLQMVYYELGMDRICRKIRNSHHYEYDLNAILSDLIYTRVLEPGSKRSSYAAAKKFLEPPTYEQHDIYRALSVLASECDLIQSEVYKNSKAVINRNDHILYYDCTNYYFEIEQEEGDKKYGKSKEHRPNPIIQMGLFTDGDGIPLAFSTFPGNQNEQTSLKPLEQKVIEEFGCEKFIFCSDSGLGSENNRLLNHTGNRAYIVTQSIKKLGAEYREAALNRKGFRRLSDNRLVDLDQLDENDYDELFYKEEPYSTKKLENRLLITYSPKYAAYQKEIRTKQVERALHMLKDGNHKKTSKNPNDPARFIDKAAVTKDGEKADILYFLDKSKIAEEERYDGLYAVCTDLFDDNPADLLKVSEGRWQIEACFRIMKTDFEARPVYVRREDRIQAHFLICFLSLLFYRLLEKKLGGTYTCCEILDTLRSFQFADIQGQGFMPVYEVTALTDRLHELLGFATDYEFLTKSRMKTIEKLSKQR
ncbi:IS1634 family transposase [Hungatella effluvii]|uniref:IS1634 family transposase n=1 Tax=Hungatella effluvii TaxID=1096246 RepID=UPI0022DF1BAE|nr:IS1634 family transposase [Hungatella effluvii]